MLEINRKSAFHVWDFMQGAPVRNHMEQLERGMHDASWASGIRSKKLEGLLLHVSKNVKYYSGLGGGHATPLSTYPVLTKHDVQRSYLDFLAPGFHPKRLTMRSTSGTYGTPLHYWLTPEECQQKAAELIFFTEWSGFSLGERHMYMFHARKEGFHPLRNQVVMNPTSLSDAWLASWVARLQYGDIRCIVSPPSVMTALLSYCTRKSMNLSHCGVKSVITVSEALSHTLRNKISQLFSCLVLGRYALEEQGVVAHQCIRGNYHVNPIRHHVELLRVGSDQPALAGEISRVVITNLAAYAMPLIRYETGDLALTGGGCTCGREGIILKEIVGREMDVLTAEDGTEVFSLSIANIFTQSTGLLQFRLVQTSVRQFTLQLVREEALLFSESAIVSQLRNLLGCSVGLNVHYVDQISSMPGGKRPAIINEYRRSQYPDGRAEGDQK